ncbi:MAG: hypothetical protein A3F68_09655 [Acidobacteria bacterium RIFCSPLOWO2_12_FULL_54_10]|nr:MAG: hypothetical protein A3F68_09655 [Acidobacteria bacterium RIFCSPLOWO2_12_FULL_54_10]
MIYSFAMKLESWFKVGLPALPIAFTVVGVWIYWKENPIPILAPQVAFWGVAITFYLFTYLYKPGSRSPYVLSVCTSLFWFISALTSHNMGRFVSSTGYSGIGSILSTADFWFAYIFAILAMGPPLYLFMKFEPQIAIQVEKDREAIKRES